MQLGTISPSTKKRQGKRKELYIKLLISIIIFIPSSWFFVTTLQSSYLRYNADYYTTNVINNVPKKEISSVTSVDRREAAPHDHEREIKRVERVERVETERRPKEARSEGGGDDKFKHNIEATVQFLKSFLTKLHTWQANNPGFSSLEIWEGYYKMASTIILPWDRSYLKEMKTQKRRNDDSIFLSVASYRDENCLPTLTGAYKNSRDPHLLNVGLVQQNCVENCKSGVLEGGKIADIEPDDDCYEEFCKTEWGAACRDGRVRVIKVDEKESLGPYFARWLGSKLWNGEDWYMQIDSHMLFAQDWDRKSVKMLLEAPSEKPVLTSYPPAHSTPLQGQIGTRICDPIIAQSDIESQIIRLQGSLEYDKVRSIPRFAPFVAAGYFVAHSRFLTDVPFDPFLPWIFMGEEISLSARLWTSGYDIFSPPEDVTSHIYVRRHKPKFWETFNRVWGQGGGGHNAVQLLVIKRVKNSLGYPECSADMIHPRSIVEHLDEYGMGSARPLEKYLAMVGIDVRKKEILPFEDDWCHKGKVPPQYGKRREELQALYTEI